MVTALVPIIARPIAVAMGWHAARQTVLRGVTVGGMGTGFSGTLLQKALTFLGVGSSFDLLTDMFGFDVSDMFGGDEGSLEDEIEQLEKMARAGQLFVAGPRRGRSPADDVPSILVMDLNGKQFHGKPMVVHEYYSRKYVRSALARQRTRNFRGAGGFRQARRVRT